MLLRERERLRGLVRTLPMFGGEGEPGGEVGVDEALEKL